MAAWVLLRTKKLLDTSDIGKLRPRRDGPFAVLARASGRVPTPARLRCRVKCDAAPLSASIAKLFFESRGAGPGARLRPGAGS